MYIYIYITYVSIMSTMFIKNERLFECHGISLNYTGELRTKIIYSQNIIPTTMTPMIPIMIIICEEKMQIMFRHIRKQRHVKTF